MTSVVPDKTDLFLGEIRRMYSVTEAEVAMDIGSRLDVSIEVHPQTQRISSDTLAYVESLARKYGVGKITGWYFDFGDKCLYLYLLRDN